MNRHSTLRLATLAAALSAASSLYAFPFGPGPGFAGAPGESSCASCHGGGQVNVGGGSVALNVMNYTPGATQRVVVTISDPTAQRWGFEATPRVAADNSNAGTLASTDGNTQVVSSGPLQYVEHTLAGTRLGTTGAITFEFDWTPPAAAMGDIVIYLAANAANGNNAADPGDHIYTQSFRLPQAAAPPPPAAGPTFAATNAVVNGASFLPGVTPGAWITIQGANLAPSTRTWRPDEIVNGALPTALDGVSVTVNGKPAAVNFISPTQLNVQAPDDNAVGSVEVRVTTPQGTANTTATTQPFAPAFFMYDPGNRRYIAAQHADFAILAPAGLFPGAVSSPARSGEVVLFYGTGFGPTIPATPAGMLVTTAAPIDLSLLTVTIGGVPAEVQFGGIVGAGLWQLNVKVPDGLPNGDAAVAAAVAGIRTQDNAFIAIQN